MRQAVAAGPSGGGAAIDTGAVDCGRGLASLPPDPLSNQNETAPTINAMGSATNVATRAARAPSDVKDAPPNRSGYG